MKRLWKIDFARGIALCLMLVSNFVTDLQIFRDYNQNSNFWWAFARVTAFLFVFIAGISMVLYHRKVKKFTKFLKRGAIIFGAGMIITLTTLYFIPQEYIRWGVLHLIGSATILAYPLLVVAQPVWSLLIGAAIIAFGFIVQKFNIGSNVLAPLGITLPDFATVDYFPLMPWLGVVLLGVWFGKTYVKVKPGKTPKAAKPICFLGKHTLWIYFLHQPLFIFIITAI